MRRDPHRKDIMKKTKKVEEAPVKTQEPCIKEEDKFLLEAIREIKEILLSIDSKVGGGF